MAWHGLVVSTLATALEDPGSNFTQIWMQIFSSISLAFTRIVTNPTAGHKNTEKGRPLKAPPVNPWA